MPNDRPKYPDAAVVMDEHVTAEYVAELSARIAELEAEVARKNSEIERLRDGKDMDRHLIAHLTRAVEALGMTAEDDPLQVARDRMQEIADGDVAPEKLEAEIARLRLVIERDR